ncbi:hypothetical protein HPL003_07085 [Paenibacillus terrae HPL-003]|uniref:Uncharacterized protein n=1 Tax=Paenibacillus terrae (strain HPL-003) TaxID=985665 RepID=G7VTX0_PAETH|nr:hypothetical protein HPL003_07085 [Paenibacillus terrae HPL-003]
MAGGSSGVGAFAFKKSEEKGLIGGYDVEHQVYADSCNFTEFLA